MWLDVIEAIAALATTVIAFLALKTWQRQDKAKREAEFLDGLLEAAHTYIAEMPKPITLLDMVKIGMASHAPTWEEGDEAGKAVKGAIAYIREHGEGDAKRLREVLGAIRPSTTKLRSLAAKGQVFKFDGYANCYNAVTMLTWHFDRIEALIGVLGSPAWNWEHPEVRETLNILVAIRRLQTNLWVARPCEFKTNAVIPAGGAIAPQSRDPGANASPFNPWLPDRACGASGMTARFAHS